MINGGQFEIDTLLSLMREIDQAPMENISKDNSRDTDIVVVHQPNKDIRNGVTIIDKAKHISVKITQGYEDIYFEILKPMTFFRFNEPSFYKEYRAFKKRMEDKFNNAQLIKKRERINLAINKVYPNIADRELLE